jgi:hypothetical protein
MYRRLETGATRLVLAIGVGFTACLAGYLLSLSVVLRLPAGGMAAGAALLVLPHLWMPIQVGLSYGAARAIDLRPLPSALAASLTAVLLALGIDAGVGSLESPALAWPLLSGRLISLAAAVLLTRWAISRARATAEKTTR